MTEFVLLDFAWALFKLDIVEYEFYEQFNPF